MIRLQNTFNRLSVSRRKALIPFIMAGDPDLATTRNLLIALDEAGADVIEIGIPFSDPLADGPVIQASSFRALSRGTDPQRVFEAVASVSGKLRAPVVALTYWNLLLQFGGKSHPGPAAFMKAAKEHGLSGVIVPDLPVEEGGPLMHAAAASRMAAVFLAAPTSPADRLRKIARASSGFIYYVSVAGTTGVRRELPPNLVQGVRQLKAVTTKPVCVGFGIATAQQASQVAAVADGVIVGSALVQVINNAKGAQAAVRNAGRFVRRLRQAV